MDKHYFFFLCFVFFLAKDTAVCKGIIDPIRVFTSINNSYTGRAKAAKVSVFNLPRIIINDNILSVTSVSHKNLVKGNSYEITQTTIFYKRNIDKHYQACFSKTRKDPPKTGPPLRLICINNKTSHNKQ